MVIFHSYVSLPEGTGHIWPFWEKQICLIPLQMCRDRLKTRRKRGPWVWWSLFGERWPRLVEAPRWRSEPVRAMQPGSLRGADFCGDFAWGFDFIFKKNRSWTLFFYVFFLSRISWMNSKSRDIEGFLSESPLWKSAGLDIRRKTFFFNALWGECRRACSKFNVI